MYSYNNINEILYYSNKEIFAKRRSWDSEIYIKLVKDATTKRKTFGVGIKPFIAITNDSDYGMEIYIPSQEDKMATDWVII